MEFGNNLPPGHGIGGPCNQRDSVQGCSACFGKVWANCMFLLEALKFYQTDKNLFESVIMFKEETNWGPDRQCFCSYWQTL